MVTVPVLRGRHDSVEACVRFRRWDKRNEFLSASSSRVGIRGRGAGVKEKWSERRGGGRDNGDGGKRVVLGIEVMFQ